MSSALVKYPKHAKAVECARADIGVAEEPAHSNSGRVGRRSHRIVEMQRNTWLGGTGWPWCVAAWQTWTKEAGLPCPYRTAGAYDLAAWAQRSGHVVPLGAATPGDCVVFNLGSGHVGLFVSQKSGKVTTIDGNTDDQVARRVRPTSVVRCVVHIAEHPIPAPAPKPPLFEVVESESGHKVVYVSNARNVGKKIAQILGKHPLGVTIRRRRAKK